MKWTIKDQNGRYLEFTLDEAGTTLCHRDKSRATVFDQDETYMKGFCDGLHHMCGEFFTAEPLIHISLPKTQDNEQVADLYAGE